MVDALHLARVRAADAENRAEAVRRLNDRAPKAPPVKTVPVPAAVAHVPPPAPVPAVVVLPASAAHAAPPAPKG